MKRSMLFVCVALLAVAVGCGKKKDEKKADDKGGEMKPTDPATAGGDTKPADPAMAGGDTKPADPAAGGDVAADTASICKKLEEMATKEGGEAQKNYESRMKADCAKEIDEARGKKGEQALKDFAACLNTAATLTAAMETCKQIN